MTLQSADPRSLDGRHPLASQRLPTLVRTSSERLAVPSGCGVRAVFRIIARGWDDGRARPDKGAFERLAREFARNAYTPMVVDIDATE